MLEPVLKEIAQEHNSTVKICKVNVDEEQDLATEFNVLSIPTLVIFKNGKIVKSTVGFHSKSELEKMIETV